MRSRIPSASTPGVGALDLRAARARSTFEAPDLARFPCLRAGLRRARARAAPRRRCSTPPTKWRWRRSSAGRDPLHRHRRARAPTVLARVADAAAARRSTTRCAADARGARAARGRGWLAAAPIHRYSQRHDRVLLQGRSRFLVTLGVLVVIHELGHYSWSRAVRRQGAALLGRLRPRRLVAALRRATGTEWALSAIPLGGYVKMVDEREGDVAAGRPAARVQPAERVEAHRDRRGRADRQPAARGRCCSRARSWPAFPGQRAVLAAPPRRHAPRPRPACAPATSSWPSTASRCRAGRTCAGACSRRGRRDGARWRSSRDGRARRAAGARSARHRAARDRRLGRQRARHARACAPTSAPPLIAEVVAGQARRQRAGLQAGDRIVAIDGDAGALAGRRRGAHQRAAGRADRVPHRARRRRRADITVTPEAAASRTADASASPASRSRSIRPSPTRSRSPCATGRSTRWRRARARPGSCRSSR